MAASRHRFKHKRHLYLPQRLLSSTGMISLLLLAVLSLSLASAAPHSVRNERRVRKTWRPPAPLPSIHIGVPFKTKYTVDEAVVASFINPDAEEDDWIGISAAGTDVGGVLPDDGSIEDWAWSCGTQDCDGVAAKGVVPFRLPPGTYQAYLLENSDAAPYKIKAYSKTFTVQETEKPASVSSKTTDSSEEDVPHSVRNERRARKIWRPPVPLDLPSVFIIPPSKTMCYTVDEAVAASFINPDAKKDDWIGISSAGTDVGGMLPDDDSIVDWALSCGTQDCDGLATKGEASFRLPSGTYQAYLLENSDAAPYKIKAYSKPFTVEKTDRPASISSKVAYSGEEDVVISVINVFSTKYNWIALSDPGAVVNGTLPDDESFYDNWAYSCGSQDCDTYASGGRRNINFGRLWPGEYQVHVLLNDDAAPYKVKRSSAIFRVLESVKATSVCSSYAPAEDVIINFVNSAPSDDDWIVVSKPGSQVEGKLPLPDELWYEDWANLCGNKECKGSAYKGEINFGRLPPGDYQAYIISGEDAPYPVRASSEIFTVEGNFDLVSVSPASKTFTASEDVVIDFANPYPTEHNWIAIAEYRSEFIVGAFLDDSWVKAWAWSRECTDCEGLYAELGEIDFGKLPPGEYKAFFLMKGSSNPYTIMAHSESFAVTVPPISRIEARTAYAPTENVLITFDVSDPTNDDWIAISTPGSEVEGKLPLPDDHYYEDWANLCGTKDCKGTSSQGEINFGRLPPGDYQAYIVTGEDAPYAVKASSEIFTVGGNFDLVSVSPASKTFTASENVVIDFANPYPTQHNWIAVVDYTSEIDVAKYLHHGWIKTWAWSCGSKDCEGYAEMGEIDFGKLPPGEYKAFLLMTPFANPYTIMAHSESFAVVAPPSSIEAQTIYAPAEDVVVTFANPDPTKDDWIVISKPGSDIEGKLPLPDDYWYEDWANLCGTKECKGSISRGEINFGRLSPGDYQAYIVSGDDAPYAVKASSGIFRIEGDFDLVSVSPACKKFARSENVVIDFANPYPTEHNWIAIVESRSEFVAGRLLLDDISVEAWAWSCGSTDCEGYAGMGEIDFGKLPPGEYKALFLMTATSVPYTIMAHSESFAVVVPPASLGARTKSSTNEPAPTYRAKAEQLVEQHEGLSESATLADVVYTIEQHDDRSEPARFPPMTDAVNSRKGDIGVVPPMVGSPLIGARGALTPVVGNTVNSKKGDTGVFPPMANAVNSKKGDIGGVPPMVGSPLIGARGPSKPVVGNTVNSKKGDTGVFPPIADAVNSRKGDIGVVPPMVGSPLIGARGPVGDTVNFKKGDTGVFPPMADAVNSRKRDTRVVSPVVGSPLIGARGPRGPVVGDTVNSKKGDTGVFPPMADAVNSRKRDNRVVSPMVGSSNVGARGPRGPVGADRVNSKKGDIGVFPPMAHAVNSRKRDNRVVSPIVGSSNVGARGPRGPVGADRVNSKKRDIGVFPPMADAVNSRERETAGVVPPVVRSPLIGARGPRGPMGSDTVNSKKGDTGVIRNTSLGNSLISLMLLSVGVIFAFYWAAQKNDQNEDDSQVIAFLRQVPWYRKELFMPTREERCQNEEQGQSKDSWVLEGDPYVRPLGQKELPDGYVLPESLEQKEMPDGFVLLHDDNDDEGEDEDQMKNTTESSPAPASPSAAAKVIAGGENLLQSLQG